MNFSLLPEFTKSDSVVQNHSRLWRRWILTKIVSEDRALLSIGEISKCMQIGCPVDYSDFIAYGLVFSFLI